MDLVCFFEKVKEIQKKDLTNPEKNAAPPLAVVNGGALCYEENMLYDKENTYETYTRKNQEIFK